MIAIIEEKQNFQNIALDLLVNLAQKGEIDPWNVNLIELIDKFLAQISNDNLKEAAEIIFFVSVLLRIKSEKIYIKAKLENEFDDLDLFNEEINFEELNLESPYEKEFEKEFLDSVLMRNQKSFKEKRKKNITLEDLIQIFKSVELPKKINRKKKINFDDFNDEEGIIIREDESSDILELAHEENLEEKIKILSEHILKIIEMNSNIALSKLEIVFGNKIDTFLSALFLSHSGKTEIQQEKFYEEIFLKRLI